MDASKWLGLDASQWLGLFALVFAVGHEREGLQQLDNAA
jgi:hypothetical protein